ncbi:MAG TPA: hypothetical protein PKL31_16265 [Fulvivirga sp.]|nr:hypothetical protein [Fulvivirga sp.]
MSDKDLDNLFKNKLEDFGKVPASDLWNKIDGQIEPPHKKKAWLYLSIAASLLLLLTFTFVLINDTKQIPTQIAKVDQPEAKDNIKHKTPEQKSSVDTTKSQQHIEKTPIKSNKNIDSKPKASKSKSAKLSNPMNIQPSIARHNPANSMVDTMAIPQQEVVIDVHALENIANNTTTDATIAAPSASEHKDTRKGKTLEFDISQFEAQKTIIAANADDNKDSKLKRIIKIAKDIKDGESGLGDIREAKNELFAFNLKKGK